MGRWRHRLTSVDPEAGTATCTRDGLVDVVWRKDATLTRQTPRCAVGIAESKDRAAEREIRERWGRLKGLTIT